jgi:RNA polymerase sigma-70 factor (ECF subfamily)
VEGVLNAAAGARETPAEDADVFAAELVACMRSALLLARRAGLSSEDAADAVQDSAAQAWRYRSGRRGDFQPWFLAIVYRRARRRIAWLTVPAFWGAGRDTGFVAGFDPGLAAALRRLPQRQRVAIWLRYGEDMSTAQVAEVIGTTETAAKQLLQRGRDALRRDLEPIDHV